MHFAFEPDQQAFADATGALLDDLAPPSTLRDAWQAGPGELDRTVWDALGEMGVLDACAPEAAGGLGLDELSLVLALEQAGRVALPHPLVETAVVVAPLLRHPIQCRMVTTDIGGAAAPCAADADLLLVANGSTLHLVDRAAVTIEETPSVDGGRRLGTIRWEPGGTTTELADGPDDLARARQRGALGTASMLLGLGRTVLDMAVAHSCEREQFGVAIGSFQAVKHSLAEVAKNLHFARPVVHRAAHSLAVDDPARSVHVAEAKVIAARAASGAARASLQCHGAIGYTVEHDLHLFLERIWALIPAWGDPASHRRTISRSLGLWASSIGRDNSGLVEGA